MKTLFVLFLTLILTVNTKAQSENFVIEFMGIKIDGPIENCAQKFVAKGFTIKRKDGHIYTMSGIVKGENVELYLVATPITRVMCKLSVYFPEKYTWFGIKSDYEDLKSTLTEKYGAPESDYHLFSSPYYEGDGYETTAVKIEKCLYACFWEEKPSLYGCGYMIMLQISRYMQVKLEYENTKNINIKSKEEKQINNKTF